MNAPIRREDVFITKTIVLVKFSPNVNHLGTGRNQRERKIRVVPVVEVSYVEGSSRSPKLVMCSPARRSR